MICVGGVGEQKVIGCNRRLRKDTTIQQAWQKIVKRMFRQAWNSENILQRYEKSYKTWHLHSFKASFFYRNAGINELQNLKYLPRSSTEREIFFEDRTPAHADHVGFGLDRITTAAVGEYHFVSAFIFSGETRKVKYRIILFAARNSRFFDSLNG